MSGDGSDERLRALLACPPSRPALVSLAVQSLSLALEPSASYSGLQIPVLIELIVKYLIDSGVSTWIGSGRSGYSNGTCAADAKLNFPMAVAVLPNRCLLVADQLNNMIRCYDPRTDTVSAYAGKPTEVGSANGGRLDTATFVSPQNVIVDHNNPNRLFVAESRAIRTINAETGVVSTLFGGSGGYRLTRSSWAPADEVTDYELAGPLGMALSHDSGVLYVADRFNSVLRGITVTAGRAATVSSLSKAFTQAANALDSDGFGIAAGIDTPRCLAFDRTTYDAPRSLLYITCCSGIRRYDVRTTEFTTLKFSVDPTGIDCTPSGLLLISSSQPQCIWSVDPRTGDAVRLAGQMRAVNSAGANGNPLTEAEFSFQPWGLTLVEDGEYSLAIADAGANQIRRLPLPPRFFIPYQPPLAGTELQAEAAPEAGAEPGVEAGDATAATSAAAALQPLLRTK